MPIVDIIIIVLLLIGAIVGVVKGFVNSIFGFIATLVAMVGAYFLAKPFINFLQSFWDVQGMVNGWCISLLGKISGFDLSCETSEAFLQAVESSRSGMGLVAPIFGSWFDSLVAAAPELSYPTSVAAELAPKLASPLLMVMAWLILFILLRIVLVIIEKLLDKVLHVASLKTIDRILGIFIGVAKVGIFIIVLLTIATLVFPNPENVVMKYILDSKIAVWINSWNPLPGWLSSFIPL